MDYLNTLYEMHEILSKQLEDAARKLRGAGEKLSGGDLDYIDKLTHAIKSVKTTIAMCEAEDGGMSFAMRTVEPGREHVSYRGYGSYDGGSYGGMSGRRGRSPMTGRFVSRAGGYSGHGDEYVDMVQEAMDRDPDGTRRKLEQMLNR